MVAHTDRTRGGGIVIPDIDAMVAAELRDAAERNRRRAEIDGCPAYGRVADRLDALVDPGSDLARELETE